MTIHEREMKRKSVVGSMMAAMPENTVQKPTQKDTQKKLVQKGYYLTPEIAEAVKIRAIKDGVKGYEVVQIALEQYLGQL